MVRTWRPKSQADGMRNHEINLPTAFSFNERGADLFSVWLGRFAEQSELCSAPQPPGVGQTG